MLHSGRCNYTAIYYGLYAMLKLHIDDKSTFIDFKKVFKWISVTFLLGTCNCLGIYEEFDLSRNCGNVVDLVDETIIGWKVTLDDNRSFDHKDVCSVTFTPWFKWNRIAIELTDLNLAHGACLDILQGRPSPEIDTLIHFCRRNQDTKVLPLHTSTDERMKIMIKYWPGLQPSKAVVKLFAFQDPPCEDGIFCDGDKCLSTVMRCKDNFLFGNCSATTRCDRPEVKEESLKLTVPLIIGIVVACLALVQLLYCLCKHCIWKKLCVYQEAVSTGESDDMSHDTDAANNVQLTNRIPEESTPFEPSVIDMPPPSYDDVMSGIVDYKLSDPATA